VIGAYMQQISPDILQKITRDNARALFAIE
jgi:hypothetical protein